MKYILFLDKGLYPNHLEAYSKLKENLEYNVVYASYEDLLDVIDKFVIDYERVDSPDTITLYSIFPELIKSAKIALPAADTYFVHEIKSRVNKDSDHIRKVNTELVIPKLKLSEEKELDPLEVSTLFSLSPSKCIKYQCKDKVTQILEYRGMESFIYMTSLTEGVLTPATMQEYEIVYGGKEVLPRDLVLQYTDPRTEASLGVKLYCIETKKNDSEGYTWYEVNELPVHEELLNLVRPEEMTYNNYIYIKDLNGVFISSIYQGVHPLIPINYLND